MKSAARKYFVLVLTAVLFAPACVQSVQSADEGGNPSAGRKDAAINPNRSDEPEPATTSDRSEAGKTSAAPAAAKNADTPSDDHVSFALGHEPGDMLYYVIEREYRESGGVPPLLTYSTVIKDRTTISQRVMPRSVRPVPKGPDGEDEPVLTLLWKVDRYEVTEQGMKDTVSFDSVRHTYPPPTLWELGGIDGASITISMDPRNSQSEVLNITPSKTAGSSTRQPLSKLAAKCQLTNESLAALLHDLGPYWMPEAPVEIGENWTRSYSENLRNFGSVVTTLNCTLQSVRKIGDRRIARVEIMGDVVLEPPPQPTTRPGQPPRANQREFAIERSTCRGTVEFDLVRGELYSLNLHRELHLFAEVESERSGTMQLKTGWGDILKVRTGHTPPPKPIIVGGPKPPDEPKE